MAIGKNNPWIIIFYVLFSSLLRVQRKLFLQQSSDRFICDPVLSVPRSFYGTSEEQHNFYVHKVPPFRSVELLFLKAFICSKFSCVHLSLIIKAVEEMRFSNGSERRIFISFYTKKLRFPIVYRVPL